MENEKKLNPYQKVQIEFAKLMHEGFSEEQIKEALQITDKKPVERKPVAHGEIHFPIKDVLYIQKEILGKTNYRMSIAPVCIIMAKVYCRTMGINDLEKTEFGVNLSKDDYAIVHYREYK